VPVVGGNVSLYNEGGEGPIYPTPIVGMVGRLPDARHLPIAGFAEAGHAVAVLGPFAPALAGSELEKLRGHLARELPAVDLDEQAAGLTALRATVRQGGLATVHDVSEGGLGCALAECCIAQGIGARIDLSAVPAEGDDARLFGEGPGGAVVAGPSGLLDRLPGAIVIGETGGNRLQIGDVVNLEVATLRERFEGAIPAVFA
jgi:phosphoribosylformylglycinamidine (FGAM) synthase-like enzyme